MQTELSEFVEELMERIIGNLQVLNQYYKIYRAECEQGKRSATVTISTDVLADKGIDVLMETFRNTSSAYFMKGEKREVLELYDSELTGCLKEINAVCPNGADEPVYEKEGIKRLYPKPGNVLAGMLKKMIQDGWAILPVPK